MSGEGWSGASLLDTAQGYFCVLKLERSYCGEQKPHVAVRLAPICHLKICSILSSSGFRRNPQHIRFGPKPSRAPRRILPPRVGMQRLLSRKLWLRKRMTREDDHHLNLVS